VIDPTGFIVTTIRDAAPVAALVSGRVGGGKPTAGWALGPGSYQRFVVVVLLGRARQRRLPMQDARWAARCYGLDEKDAALVASAVSDSIHARGPRVSPSGVGIWVSFDDSDTEGAAEDPVTHQPYQTVLISAVATDRLLT